MSLIIQIPGDETTAPNDNWAEAYAVQSRVITDLYASPIEQIIRERGGHLFGPDGTRERPTIQGVIIDDYR